MAAIKDYFSQLLESATQANHRYGVVIEGSEHWQQQCIEALMALIPPQDIFLLGGTSPNSVGKSVAYKKGQQLLGQECQLLCCDFRDGFDANSFTAATGCVRGGGLVVIIPALESSSTPDQIWLNDALKELIVVEEGNAPPLPHVCGKNASKQYEDQQVAIERINKVVKGHRKRPLVMTADRGRGKSSALGIAASQLMQERTIHIIVTAPGLATVKPVFEHAERCLPQATVEKGVIHFQQSKLEFVAPDELLRQSRHCDLLLVDEASAIPIPMLKKMVEIHHRAVFSTTIHGYEGCGRGFTVKFQAWLNKQRPGTQFFHLEQPIRWSQNDPLEIWLFDSFLLNTEIADIDDTATVGQLRLIDKQQLLAQPQVLRSCFALLVNAHYQTAPNDLMLLLHDDAIQLHAIIQGDGCLGCMLTVEEGGLSPTLIEPIQLGKRRPKGHLVPTIIANQLGIAEAATQSSLRIMRIAVHPSLQRNGLGREMVKQLLEDFSYDYYSTSFGASSELVQFWRRCGFTPVKLGSQRDHASGTHSLVMINGKVVWHRQAQRHFSQTVHYAVSETFKQLEIDLVRNLLANCNASVEKPSATALIEAYSLGGSNFESVVPFIEMWWKSAPHMLNDASDLFIRKVVQKWSWVQCASEFDFSGSKQTEQVFRQQLNALLRLSR